MDGSRPSSKGTRPWDKKIVLKARIAFRATQRITQRKLVPVRSIRVGWSTKLVSGSLKPPLGPDDAVAVCLVRNGATHLESFLDHHRRLGVAHFFLMDNGSTDATLEIAGRHPYVTAVSCDLPFRKFKIAMKFYLLRRFAMDRWALLLDVDELFDFPHSNKMDLSSLVRYLDEHRFTAVVAQMLDMFSDRAIGELEDHDHASLLESYPFYDISSVRRKNYRLRKNTVSNPDIEYMHGGIVASAFRLDPDWRTKHPLLRVNREIRLLNGHEVVPAVVADFSCVLYHFKLTSALRKQAHEAAKLEQYSGRSHRYKRYAEALRHSPKLTLVSPNARRLEGIQQLVREGFLVVSDEFERWVATRGLGRGAAGR